jgi:predicted dehydrogenase
MTFTPYDRPGTCRIHRTRTYLRSERSRLLRQCRRRGRRARRPERRTPGAAPSGLARRSDVRVDAELAASGIELDAVEALLPIPLHVEGVIELLDNGWHVNLQKPMCNDLKSARRCSMRHANDRILRVMENYIFYEPLRKLKETVESGQIGEVSGYHMKMVGSGRGGWDVPASSWEWQFKQMQNGRGILVFDDGWHKLATAIWLFGARSERCGPGWAAPKSSLPSRLMPPARSCGSTTTGSAGCGT